MTTAEILRAARNRISDPRHWTQHDFARDEQGMPVSAISGEAVCWCARGAIDAVNFDDEDFLALEFLRRAVCERTGKRLVADFNDSVQHADVLAAFDRAIDLAEAPDALR